jgi:hypothetical protein
MNKYDKTRLSNLLDKYRDEMITVRYDNFKHNGHVGAVESVDASISMLKQCMRGEGV